MGAAASPNQPQWTAVDRYITDLLVGSDPVLEAALQANAAAGLPSIDVTPNQGKLLHLLARMLPARRILEIGTLGGYSTIWLARALPEGGRLITLEADARYAEVARVNLERAGVGDAVDLRVGPALESLPALDEKGAGPFDLVFIDADKVHTPDYFAWSLDHCRPAALIVADNVVRDGRLVDRDCEDPAIVAQRTFHEMLAGEPRVEATTIQTVGVKGYDGFTLARVIG